ncbi:MAG: His/Gly/Thr/Pro-type tRNA ligase C-terminal domain-containing protein, partial [Staphylococcus epidermidis]|nr:His/Gly/Thr/Pro-type tRNA ligase C-terminal domain-containing protein [Staphylococcus epidermidis]
NQGKAQPLIMGCYGIGVSRTLSAIVEQNNDENGIIWPKSVTPFDIHLITINPKKEDQRTLGDQLYQKLMDSYDILYDDRKERAGVKFNDSDLIGLPVRVVVGKRAEEGIVEVKQRFNGLSEEVQIDELETYLQDLFKNIK